MIRSRPPGQKGGTAAAGYRNAPCPTCSPGSDVRGTAMATNRMRGDPDAGVRDLITRLSDDSKRLMADELRLVKLELRQDVATGGRGALWLAVAFGTGVVSVTMLTLFVTTLIGRFAGGHMWIGAAVTGVLEIVVGVGLIKRGVRRFAEPSYSLEQTRDSLRNLV